MWPWRCGLMARPVSGVEWSGVICKLVVSFHNAVLAAQPAAAYKTLEIKSDNCIARLDSLDLSSQNVTKFL